MKHIGNVRPAVWNKAEVLTLAQAALKIPSFSGEEERAARFFVEAMKQAGIDARLQPVPESSLLGPSFNALGFVKGRGGGKSLMYNGHLDHNPVQDGWTKDPFGGITEDDWLYGFCPHEGCECLLHCSRECRAQSWDLTSRGHHHCACVR